MSEKKAYIEIWTFVHGMASIIATNYLNLDDAAKYNVVDIGEAIIRFIEDDVKQKVFLLGHFSGGLIAAYIAPYRKHSKRP